jgi:DNA-binding XRE family transcriptional regulator
MNDKKRTALEAAGFTVGDTQSFLGLSEAEMAVIDMKLALARELRARRTKAAVTQQTFAKKIGSSQSRVAKMEAADASVSLDLLIRAVIEAGGSRRVVANAMASSKRVSASSAGGARSESPSAPPRSHSRARR